jgi:hypothetical protein
VESVPCLRDVLGTWVTVINNPKRLGREKGGRKEEAEALTSLFPVHENDHVGDLQSHPF